MADNASTQNVYATPVQGPQLSAPPKSAENAPVSLPPTPLEESSDRKFKLPKNAIGVFLAVFFLIVIVSVVAVVARKSSSSVSGNSSEVSTTEYQNPNGFKFKYNKDLSLSENEEGIKLTGDAEMAFVVNVMSEPLSKTVKSITDNFGAGQSALDTKTINGRVGYMLSYNNANYYYFPLVGNYYLEIVDSNPGDGSSQDILSSLEFTPPQASLIQ